MSNNCNECGHTDEEHEQQKLKFMVEALKEGNIAPLVTSMENDVIGMNIIALFEEAFIRSPDDDHFLRTVESFIHQMREVIIEGMHDPKIRKELLGYREEFSKRIEQGKFEAEASSELDSMFEQHGVVETPTVTPPKEEWPGQYL